MRLQQDIQKSLTFAHGIVWYVGRTWIVNFPSSVYYHRRILLQTTKRSFSRLSYLGKGYG